MCPNAVVQSEEVGIPLLKCLLVLVRIGSLKRNIGDAGHLFNCVIISCGGLGPSGHKGTVC
jgi:hypothetical protein